MRDGCSSGPLSACRCGQSKSNRQLRAGPHASAKVPSIFRAVAYSDHQVGHEVPQVISGRDHTVAGLEAHQDFAPRSLFRDDASAEHHCWDHLTRDDLGRTLAPPSRQESTRFAALLAKSQPLDGDQLKAWLDGWTSASPGREVDVVEAAALVASVQDIEVRDTAWAVMTCADADVHIDLWRQIVQLVDGPPALPILGLLGMAAWIDGQGALANLVLDRAVETEGSSNYTLIGLLQGVLRGGINPRAWDTMRKVISGSSDVLMG